jgi:hypothetical protein
MPSSTLGWEDTSKELEFFEKRVRPILVERCLECHGDIDKPQGNLRLDAQEHWLAGGDSGPALVAGRAAESLLIKAIRYETADLEMPPSGKLPADQIATLERWVAQGATAPRGTASAVAKRTIDIEAGRSLWSYRPLEDPPIPFDASWIGINLQPIDGFVHGARQGQKLAFNPEADDRTLVRRLYLDLHGMLPTPEQSDAFLKDPRPDRWERLVDSLLNSPRFGERMARHWLDIVRYGESLTLRGFIFPDAWRFRDYVIDSFNLDRPIDQFIQQHVAGDLMDSPSLAERQAGLIATTFLALGNTNLEEQDKRQLDMDVVDEQLDTIGKAFLGQTLGCARCHDHKFDPIPTRDYYALAGILRNAELMEHANVSKWKEVNLPLPDEDEAMYQRHESHVASVQGKVQKLKKSIQAMEQPDKKLASKATGTSIPVTSLPGIVIDNTQAKMVGVWKSSTATRQFIGSDYVHDENQAKGERTLTFVVEIDAPGRYEVRLAYSHGSSRSKAVPVTVASADGESTIAVDQSLPPDIDDRFVLLGVFPFERQGQSYVLVSNEGTQGHVTADAVQFLPVGQVPPPTEPPERQEVDTGLLASLKAQLKDSVGELKELQTKVPKRPKVMTVVDRKEFQDCAVHVRGSVHSQTELVPRGFLQVLREAGSDVAVPKDQSGRKQLSLWLTHPRNPLTARVYANRVWFWITGQALVASPDNFGTTGDRPTHPELLDYLSQRLIQHGWSTKQLVRDIVTSQTYRMSSAEKLHELGLDPSNRFWWRMPRKRLEAEVIRDAMLQIASRMDGTMRGTSLDGNLTSDFGYQHQSSRRSVYLPVLRNSLPDIFQAFDFADPSLVDGDRDRSTVAPQALFLLNHAFVVEQAQAASARMDKQSTEGSIDSLWLECLSRLPTEPERQAVQRFLGDLAPVEPNAWAKVYHSLFASLDFRYRD